MKTPTITTARSFRARYEGRCSLTGFRFNASEPIYKALIDGREGYILGTVLTDTRVGPDRDNVARFDFTSEEARKMVEANDTVLFRTTKTRVRKVSRATYGDPSKFSIDGKAPVTWKVVEQRVLRSAVYAFPKGTWASEKADRAALRAEMKALRVQAADRPEVLDLLDGVYDLPTRDHKAEVARIAGLLA